MHLLHPARDLLTSIASLAAERRFDHVLIESSGILEPLPVAETFTFKDENTGSRVRPQTEHGTLACAVALMVRGSCALRIPGGKTVHGSRTVENDRVAELDVVDRLAPPGAPRCPYTEPRRKRRQGQPRAARPAADSVWTDLHFADQ
jgi:hypothetical protein